MSHRRALFGLARAVVRTWVNRASVICGGRARFTAIAALLAVGVLGVETAVVLRAGRMAEVGAQPITALAPSLGVVLLVIGMVMAALLALTMPDGDELSVFVAPSGLPRGIRRLGTELPTFAVFAGAGAVLCIPMSTNVLQDALTPGILAVRLIGAFLLTVTGLLAGRAISIAVMSLLGRIGVSRMAGVALASATTVVLGGLAMKVSQPSAADVTSPPLWRRLIGSTMLAGWLTPVMMLVLVGVGGFCIWALVAIPTGRSNAVVERPAAWLRRAGRHGRLGLTRATLLATLREPSVVMWLGFAAAAPVLLRGMNWVSGLPADIFAVFAVGLPALTAAYPFGVTRGLRQWRAAAGPATGHDAAAQFLAATLLVLGALALQAACGLLVSLPPQPAQWPLVVIVYAAALFWGHVTPVSRGESSTWVVVDVLAVVTSALVIVGGVMLADHLSATAVVFEPLSVALLAAAGGVALQVGRRRGASRS